MINLNYLTGHTLYQILMIDYFEHTFKKHREKTDNPSIENRITLKIKTGYYLELLTP